jgi:hypothetical protein
LDESGLIEGTPVEAGDSTFTVQFMDQAGNLATATLTLKVRQP